MAFSDLIAAADSTILDLLGNSLNVVIHFPDNRPDLTLDTIAKNPALADDYVPGSAQGTGILTLFARFDSTNPVLNGCTATVSGVDYDVVGVDPDLERGMSIKLRRRTQRWDQ